MGRRSACNEGVSIVWLEWHTTLGETQTPPITHDIPQSTDCLQLGLSHGFDGESISCLACASIIEAPDMVPSTDAKSAQGTVMAAEEPANSSPNKHATIASRQHTVGFAKLLFFMYFTAYKMTLNCKIAPKKLLTIGIAIL